MARLELLDCFDNYKIPNFKSELGEFKSKLRFAGEQVARNVW